MYIVHLDWNDFLDAGKPLWNVDSTSLVYVQPSRRIKTHQGIRTGEISTISAIYRDLADMLHAARIIVEVVDTFAHQNPPESFHQRSGRATDAVCRSINRAGASVMVGLLLVPGLREDLEQYQTTHSLWTWEIRY